VKLVVALIVVASFAGSAFADTWFPPTPRTYSSSQGKYRLTVFPGPVPYFQDKVDGRSPAGQQEPGLRTCEATLERLMENRYELLWRKALVNDVSPVEALVADDDGSFVTFDNWHSMGWGDDVIVVYSGAGDVVKKFALLDIMTKRQVQKLPRSVSSIWWSGNHRLTHDQQAVEVLVVVNGEIEESEQKYKIVSIRLSDGSVTR
jgi:hypothetical protein